MIQEGAGVGFRSLEIPPAVQGGSQRGDPLALVGRVISSKTRPRVSCGEIAALEQQRPGVAGPDIEAIVVDSVRQAIIDRDVAANALTGARTIERQQRRSTRQSHWKH
jgi:hypothetical protein